MEALWCVSAALPFAFSCPLHLLGPQIFNHAETPYDKIRIIIYLHSCGQVTVNKKRLRNNLPGTLPSFCPTQSFSILISDNLQLNRSQ